MKFHIVTTIVLIIMVSSSLRAQTHSTMPVEYVLSMPNPSNHLFEVSIIIQELTGTSIALHMPAWRTGRYLIQDFAGGVQGFSVHDETGRALPWEKTDKDTWRIDRRKAKTITASYKVYANEFNQRTRELNGDHAFLDPAAIFMYVDEFRTRPLQLTVIPFGDWHVTTGLEETTPGSNKFVAPTFEYFADCPIEIGNHHDFEFMVDGRRHIISIYGDGNWDKEILLRDFKSIVEANRVFWGRLPYQKYVFQIHCQPNAGGGTEHINSTIMGVRPFVFSNQGSYKGFLGLVSHEFFHTWNVKQLRPKAFAPYDFSKENYTRELWVSEGTTSYFDDLLLVKAGIRDGKFYLDLIARMIGADRSRHGNTVQPLSEASFDAWIKYWKRRQNAEMAESDYYAKGQHVSLLLDLEIRNRSHNASSLSTVMRTMFEQYPPEKGFTNADFIAICEKFAGGSLDKFFKNYLYGTTPLDWETPLSYAGLTVVHTDSAGKPGIGMTTQDVGDRTRVVSVLPGSPAEKAGIEVNDEIVALNSYKVRSAEINDRIAERKAGQTVHISLFRNDKLKEATVTIDSVVHHSYNIKKITNPTPLQKAIYEDWLNEQF